MTFIISKGPGSALTRYFQSYEGDPSLAPTLEVSYDGSSSLGCYRGTETAQVSADYDDAEEDNSGNISLSSSTLDLSSVQVGVRFRGIDVPKGATIINAYLEVNAKGSTTATPSPTPTCAASTVTSDRVRAGTLAIEVIGGFDVNPGDSFQIVT